MPLSVEVFNSQGEASGTLEVSDALFGQPENPQAVRSVLDCYLASQRQGDASTRTQGMVRGGGKKPWKQKGTGRARTGSNRSPLWRGGGTLFGPMPRDYGYRVNRKVRRVAFLSVISSLLREKRLLVLDRIELSEPKTRNVVSLRERLGIESGKKVLILTDGVEAGLRRAAANLGRASDYPTQLLPLSNLNIRDLLTCDYLVLPAAAVKALEEVYG
jgi:large subunit ribosomal protein L4